jgi:hypothetical protein
MEPKCENRFAYGEYLCLNKEIGVSCLICKRNICKHCEKTRPSLKECVRCNQKVCEYKRSFLTSCGMRIRGNFYCEKCFTFILEK